MPHFNEVLLLFTVVYIKYTGSLQTEEYYHFYVLGVAKEYNITILSGYPHRLARFLHHAHILIDSRTTPCL